MRSGTVLDLNWVATADGIIRAAYVYGHLQNKSLLVKVGDKVKQGQTIARMGTSGSALMPHLHYELQTSIDCKAEGLPSSFVNFEKSLGEKTVKIKKGQIDTGYRNC